MLPFSTLKDWSMVQISRESEVGKSTNHIHLLIFTIINLTISLVLSSESEYPRKLCKCKSVKVRPIAHVLLVSSCAISASQVMLLIKKNLIKHRDRIRSVTIDGFLVHLSVRISASILKFLLIKRVPFKSAWAVLFNIDICNNIVVIINVMKISIRNSERIRSKRPQTIRTSVHTLI